MTWGWGGDAPQRAGLDLEMTKAQAMVPFDCEAEREALKFMTKRILGALPAR